MAVMAEEMNGVKEMGKEPRAEVKKYKELLGEKESVHYEEYGAVTYLTSPKGVDEELSHYEKLRSDGTVTDVRFSAIDKKGDLYTYLPNGIRICMPNRNIDGFAHDPQRKEELSKYLCQDCPVVVKSVSRKEKIVTVSMKDALSGPQKELIDAIEKGIEDEVYIKVPAKIVSLTGKQSTDNGDVYDVALLDLGGLSVRGYVNRSQWSPCFTKTLKNVANVGDIIDVVVTKKMRWRSGALYACNRAYTISGSPWKDIEKRLPKNSTVRVKCVFREENQFIASIQGIPEIKAHCYYPNDDSVHVEEGKEYLGYVKKVSEERLQLQISILSAVEGSQSAE